MRPEQLVDAIGCTPAAAARWAEHLTAAADCYGIDNPKRLAAWLAQVGHESGLLSTAEENLRYSVDALLRVFPKYFSPATAAAYAKNPTKIANKVYAKRMGNGDEASGDGWRYHGRGLIQLTGKDNYRAASHGLGLDLIGQPDLLLQERPASMSAGWFWDSRKLNTLADEGRFEAITKSINGGLNGQLDRLRLYERALKTLEA